MQHVEAVRSCRHAGWGQHDQISYNFRVMSTKPSVIVALSGGVDSAVAALLLSDRGHDVQCVHMTNWEDDGYCNAAQDFQDARRVCRELGIPLHRVNFTREYSERVFAQFLEELERGRTPNPDVLCNREIKFGVLRSWARRLGGELLATGHYARLSRNGSETHLLKARDANKDQTYFLHAVDGADFDDVVFPLGDLVKSEVRELARTARLPVADKKDSTGICFIGERPFGEFLKRYLPTSPGPIRTLDGELLGEHDGLAFYTLGQRHGLGIGGVRGHDEKPWYVAGKRDDRNELVVVQDHDHRRLAHDYVLTAHVHWINSAPLPLRSGGALRCTAKTRYRQADQACTVSDAGNGRVDVEFDEPGRAIAPGQYIVFYSEDRCLGGAAISATQRLAQEPAQ